CARRLLLPASASASSRLHRALPKHQRPNIASCLGSSNSLSTFGSGPLLPRLADIPTEQSEPGEQERHTQRQAPLHLLLQLLTLTSVFFVLLAHLLFGSLFVVGRLLEAGVGEVWLTQNLGAGCNQIGIPAHPVQRVLHGQNRAGQEALRMRPSQHLKLLIYTHATKHLELAAKLRPVAGVGKRIGQELTRRHDKHPRLVRRALLGLDLVRRLSSERALELALCNGGNDALLGRLFDLPFLIEFQVDTVSRFYARHGSRASHCLQLHVRRLLVPE